MEERSLDTFMARKNVLVAEDSALLAMEMQDVLEENGYSVIGPAESLETAIRLAETLEIDFALLDIDLGGVKSFPVAEKLTTKNISFAFLTGYTSGYAIPNGLKPYQLLEKPYAPEKLLSLLTKFFASKKPSSG